MRASPILALALIVSLALAGCASPQYSPSAAVPTAAPAATSAAAPATAPAATPTVASAVASAPGKVEFPADAATTAIQSVIQHGNQEQQDAFAKGDPSLMSDTSTSDYYDQLVKINADMAQGGVKTISLVKIEWGDISQSRGTDGTQTAQATTYETWRTTYADGSTDQSRAKNVYTLVSEQGLWKIQADDHPDATAEVSSDATQPTPAAPANPPSPAGSSNVSNNWSGYAATGGGYTGVTGTWTVPEPPTTGNFSSGATWVGIGGLSGHDLIQAGTNETVDGAGTVHFQAWVETLPQASRPVQFTVSPGDSVTVSLDQQSSGLWLIAFKNNTTGQAYQTTLQYDSSLSSAEWVEEAPSVSRGIVPLDNFGTVEFTGGSAVKNGKTTTMQEIGAAPIKMVDANGRTLAAPSALTADGQGFSVSRTDVVPAAPVAPTRRQRQPNA
jgi:hypothetical protein